MSPSRCHLTDEHRMQFVTHAAALEFEMVTNSVFIMR